MTLKKIYATAVLITRIGLAFWFCETVYFLFAEGWHWDATNENEKILDKISLIIIRIGLYIWIGCLIHVTEKLVKAISK